VTGGRQKCMTNIYEKICDSEKQIAMAKHKRKVMLEFIEDAETYTELKFLSLEASRHRHTYEGLEKEISDYLSGCSNKEILELSNFITL